MTGAPLTEAGFFLIKTLFGLYILALLLRFLLQTAKADFNHPISQFLFKLTQPVVGPLRRRIPSISNLDTSMLLLLIALQTLEITLLSLLAGRMPSIPSIMVLALSELLSLTLWIYIITLFAIALLSWIQPGGYNPNTLLLHQFTAPVLRPVRRLIPPLQGLDLSLLATLMLLQLARILLVEPLQHLAFVLN